MVRLAPARGESIPPATVWVRSGPRELRAVDPDAAVRRFLVLDACERADWVLTYADLQVGALVERLTMVMWVASLRVRQAPPDS